MKSLAAALFAGVALVALPALSQNGHEHGGHAQPGNVEIPTDPGQDIFGAISEILQLLNADPGTDWSRVNIGALHQHLLDMDLVATQAETVDDAIETGLRIEIERRGPGGDAAAWMVQAHAPVLAAETGWGSQVVLDDNTVIWTVTASTAADATKIQALGFFGLMATGGHHQPHHLAIARGEPVH